MNINLKLINKAVFDTDLTDKEFRALYLICNNAALHEASTVEIHNAWLMNKLNLHERQVQYITKGLVTKGYLTKQVNGTKTNKNANTYTIISEMNEEKNCAKNCAKKCTLKKDITK